MSSYRQAAGRAVLAGALALGGALVLGDVKPAAAASSIPITACGTIIPVGGAGHYVLVNDLLNCPATGIRIQASDVHLDLGEHTIDHQSSGLAALASA